MNWREQQEETKRWIRQHEDIVKIIHNDRKPLNAKDITGYSLTEMKEARYLVKMKKKKERRAYENH